jgi:hypothetical protein
MREVNISIPFGIKQGNCIYLSKNLIKIRKSKPNLNRNNTLKMLDARKRIFNQTRYTIDWDKFVEEYFKKNN